VMEFDENLSEPFLSLRVLYSYRAGFSLSMWFIRRFGIDGNDLHAPLIPLRQYCYFILSFSVFMEFGG